MKTAAEKLFKLLGNNQQCIKFISSRAEKNYILGYEGDSKEPFPPETPCKCNLKRLDLICCMVWKCTIYCAGWGICRTLWRSLGWKGNFKNSIAEETFPVSQRQKSSSSSPIFVLYLDGLIFSCNLSPQTANIPSSSSQWGPQRKMRSRGPVPLHTAIWRHRQPPPGFSEKRQISSQTTTFHLFFFIIAQRRLATMFTQDVQSSCKGATITQSDSSMFPTSRTLFASSCHAVSRGYKRRPDELRVHGIYRVTFCWLNCSILVSCWGVFSTPSTTQVTRVLLFWNVGERERHKSGKEKCTYCAFMKWENEVGRSYPTYIYCKKLSAFKKHWQWTVASIKIEADVENVFFIRLSI